MPFSLITCWPREIKYFRKGNSFYKCSVKRNFAEQLSLRRNMCVCAIAMTTAAMPIDELLPPPPEQLWSILLCIMCTSIKFFCLVGSRETSHCTKHIHIWKNAASSISYCVASPDMGNRFLIWRLIVQCRRVSADPLDGMLMLWLHV